MARSTANRGWQERNGRCTAFPKLHRSERIATIVTSSMRTSEIRAQLDKGSEKGQRGTVHFFIAIQRFGDPSPRRETFATV